MGSTGVRKLAWINAECKKSGDIRASWMNEYKKQEVTKKKKIKLNNRRFSFIHFFFLHFHLSV